MKNYKCNHEKCNKRYTTLGGWFMKHCVIHHSGVMRAKRLKYSGFEI